MIEDQSRASVTRHEGRGNAPGWRWTVVVDGGKTQVVATGEAYETKAAAMKGCESVFKAATGAPLVETDS